MLTHKLYALRKLCQPYISIRNDFCQEWIKIFDRFSVINLSKKHFKKNSISHKPKQK